MFFTVACPVELSDNSEGGVGDIADVMIRHGFLSAEVQVSNYQQTTLTEMLRLTILSLFVYNEPASEL